MERASPSARYRDVLHGSGRALCDGSKGKTRRRKGNGRGGGRSRCWSVACCEPVAEADGVKVMLMEQNFAG
jgi:hypothetical protein